MIEYGPDIESQLENGVTTSDQDIAQLLQFNCHRKVPKDSALSQRHSSDRETSFAVYVGLLKKETAHLHFNSVRHMFHMSEF